MCFAFYWYLITFSVYYILKLIWNISSSLDITNTFKLVRSCLQLLITLGYLKFHLQHLCDNLPICSIVFPINIKKLPVYFLELEYFSHLCPSLRLLLDGYYKYIAFISKWILLIFLNELILRIPLALVWTISFPKDVGISKSVQGHLLCFQLIEALLFKRFPKTLGKSFLSLHLMKEYVILWLGNWPHFPFRSLLFLRKGFVQDDALVQWYFSWICFLFVERAISFCMFANLHSVIIFSLNSIARMIGLEMNVLVSMYKLLISFSSSISVCMTCARCYTEIFWYYFFSPSFFPPGWCSYFFTFYCIEWTWKNPGTILTAFNG